LEDVSSAEDLFDYFGVAYDERVLAPARLHILKRLAQYLAEHDLAVLGDDALFAAARGGLERAYADFAASSPRRERVFEELERRGRAAAGFVGLDALRPPTA
ncbi:MAG: nitrogenase-stabilizing/protective protein NifW, partial [Alphaproteobacteria bacterium]